MVADHQRKNEPPNMESITNREVNLIELQVLLQWLDPRKSVSPRLISSELLRLKGKSQSQIWFFSHLRFPRKSRLPCRSSHSSW